MKLFSRQDTTFPVTNCCIHRAGSKQQRTAVCIPLQLPQPVLGPLYHTIVCGIHFFVLVFLSASRLPQEPIGGDPNNKRERGINPSVAMVLEDKDMRSGTLVSNEKEAWYVILQRYHTSTSGDALTSKTLPPAPVLLLLSCVTRQLDL